MTLQKIADAPRDGTEIEIKLVTGLQSKGRWVIPARRRLKRSGKLGNQGAAYWELDGGVVAGDDEIEGWRPVQSD